MEVLRVSSKTSVGSLAGAIAGYIREHNRVEVQAVGAGAVNQAVKAIGVARGFLAPSGIDVIAIPAFVDIAENGEERTAVKIIVEPRR